MADVEIFDWVVQQSNGGDRIDVAQFQAWYQQAQPAAQAAGVERLELDWYIQALTRLDRLQLRLLAQSRASPRSVDAPRTETARLTDPPRSPLMAPAAIELAIAWSDFQARWQRRLDTREPVQYLVGWTAWRDLILQVSPAVLIPRPETELVIDWVRAAVQQQPQLLQGDWADLGTGSGAIALGLARAFPAVTLHGVDISPEALAIARANAQRYQASILWHQGPWFEPLRPQSLMVMVSNPPYIPTTTVQTLDPEVRQHEPSLALDGGADGLVEVQALIAAAPDYLQAGGLWLVEVMAGQAQRVAQALAQDGRYHQIQIHPDLAGIERFVQATRR